MGAGTSSPGHKLDVRGTARAETFIADFEYKTQDAGVVKHGGVLAKVQFTWRRVVPKRWSGYIVWTPVAPEPRRVQCREQARVVVHAAVEAFPVAHLTAAHAFRRVTSPDAHTKHEHLRGLDSFLR